MVKASAVLPGVVADIVRKAPLTPEKVAMAWRLSVGAALARSTRVRLDEGGVLHVEAETPAWAAAVRASRALVRTRLGHLLGDETVREIRIAR